MGGWFTVEPIDGDTFAISEYAHWEQTHAYLLCGREASLLIDSGLGIADIGEVVSSLTDKPVTAVTTHVHWDHIGGLGLFAHFGVHAAERRWIAGDFPLPLSAVRQSLTARPCVFPPGFDAGRYTVFRGEPSFTYEDGCVFSLGGRDVEAIHTPGHSPGHCCFYDRGRGYMFTGDLVYAGCLDAYYPSTDPERFCASLQRIAGYGARRLLPGHYRLDIPPSLAEEAAEAFAALKAEGKLHHGAGTFDFGAFQIRL